MATLLDPASTPQVQGGHHINVNPISDDLLNHPSPALTHTQTPSLGMEFNQTTPSIQTAADTVLSPSVTGAVGLDRSAFTVTALNSEGRLCFNPSLSVTSLPQTLSTVGVSNLQAAATSINSSVSLVDGGAGGGGGGQMGEGATDHTDLAHMLSGLQHAGDLSSILQQRPHLAEGLSAIASGDVSTDPESLRFQYTMEDEPVSADLQTPTRKQAPSVYREQYRFLPIANVARIMRNAIPKNGKVSKDAKECMQECVSEFISFITSEACDKCSQEKRKTITGDDILFAMATLGFDNYIDPLRLYLQKYREFTRTEKMASVGTAAADAHKRRMSDTPPSLQQLSSGMDVSTSAPQLTEYSSYGHLVPSQPSEDPTGAEQ